MISYYRILDIDPSADDKTILNSYIKKMKNYKKKNNKQYYDLISESYEILSDPIKKSLYDKLLLENRDIRVQINFTDTDVLYNSVIKKNKKFVDRTFVNKYPIRSDVFISDNIHISHVFNKSI